MAMWKLVAGVCAGLAAMLTLYVVGGLAWVFAAIAAMVCFGFVYRIVWWSDIAPKMWDRFAEPTNIVAVTESELKRKSPNSLRWGSISWANVTEVGAEAVDKFTYRENFLLLCESPDRWLSIGELDVAFKAALAVINSKFPGIETDWYGRLEQGEPGLYITIWRKIAETSA